MTLSEERVRRILDVALRLGEVLAQRSIEERPPLDEVDDELIRLSRSGHAYPRWVSGWMRWAGCRPAGRPRWSSQ